MYIIFFYLIIYLLLIIGSGGQIWEFLYSCGAQKHCERDDNFRYPQFDINRIIQQLITERSRKKINRRIERNVWFKRNDKVHILQVGLVKNGLHTTIDKWSKALVFDHQYMSTIDIVSKMVDPWSTTNMKTKYFS